MYILRSAFSPTEVNENEFSSSVQPRYLKWKSIIKNYNNDMLSRVTFCEKRETMISFPR